MRWEALFADLAAQIAADGLRDFDREVMDRTRAELAQVKWVGRLEATLGSSVRLRHRAGGIVVGQVRQIGRGWVLIDQGPQAAVVPFGSVMSISGLGRDVEPMASGPGHGRLSLTLAHAMRALARDRAYVTVVTDAGSLGGTIDRVGEDFIDLAIHPEDQPRRRDSYETVPFSAIIIVIQV